MSEVLKRGTVHLHWMIGTNHGIDVPAWNGYWDQEPDGPPEMLEESPVFTSLRDALEWAQARAARTYIQMDHSGFVWHFGEGLAAADKTIAGAITLRATPVGDS